MKRYLIWFSLMMKRMVKKPAFILLLFVMLLSAIALSVAEQGERTGNAVGIMIDEEQENVGAGEETWNRRLLSMFTEPVAQEGIFVFRVYENREHLVRDVKRGELECGVVLPGDLEERLNAGMWQDSVMIYETDSAGMTEIVKERIASEIFTFYAEKSYVNLVENTEAFLQAEKNENGVTRKEIISFAQEAYENHLADGSTFAFTYHGDDPKGQTEKRATGTSTFRLRGILAVCIFLSGLCGLLTDWKDREQKRFVRIVPDWVTTAVNVWVPTIYTSFVTLLCLLTISQAAMQLDWQFAGADAVTGGGAWVRLFIGIGKEMCHLLFYQFLIVCYCSIIRLLLRKQEMIAAAVPILTFASVICSPVWIWLAVYIPFFRVLEKLFPATYYLLM